MEKEELLKKLKDFYEVPKTSKYELLRLKGPCTIILYSTGKVSIQGKEEIVNKIKEDLGLETEKETIKTNKQTSLFSHTKIKLIIGSDETLKGDTFGGLIVAGFKADETERKKLELLKVEDSKKMYDGQIMRLAIKLKESFPKNFHIIELKPLEYNELTKNMNVTALLNKLHKQVNDELKTENSIHIVDKYPGCNIGDIITERAESKYLEVAAASIIARDTAIKQINRLSEEAGFIIPKGSTHVEQALKKLKIKKIDPKKFVKLNFSNVKNFF